jgi:hypothetical protein
VNVSNVKVEVVAGDLRKSIAIDIDSISSEDVDDLARIADKFLGAMPERRDEPSDNDKLKAERDTAVVVGGNLCGRIDELEAALGQIQAQCGGGAWVRPDEVLESVSRALHQALKRPGIDSSEGRMKMAGLADEAVAIRKLLELDDDCGALEVIKDIKSSRLHLENLRINERDSYRSTLNDIRAKYGELELRVEELTSANSSLRALADEAVAIRKLLKVGDGCSALDVVKDIQDGLLRRYGWSDEQLRARQFGLAAGEVKLAKVEQGQVWKSVKGGMYEVVFIANKGSDRLEDVVYRGLTKEGIWTKPLALWHKTMSLHSECQIELPDN